SWKTRTRGPPPAPAPTAVTPTRAGLNATVGGRSATAPPFPPAGSHSQPVPGSQIHLPLGPSGAGGGTPPGGLAAAAAVPGASRQPLAELAVEPVDARRLRPDRRGELRHPAELHADLAPHLRDGGVVVQRRGGGGAGVQVTVQLPGRPGEPRDRPAGVALE